jgi:hypothetical protein
MTVSRLDGWTVSLLIALLAVYPPSRLVAQHVAFGPQIVFGDYREVSSDLHYRGSGGGLAITASWRKFSADAVVSKVKYKPSSDGTAILEVDAREFDVRLRYYIAGPVSAELGFISREADPEFEAQSVGAVTAGARMSYLLGPGVHMALNGALILGPKFSGGGRAGPLGAFGLGLGLSVDALRGRLQFTGDYDFQRITRKTDDGSRKVSVPIQQSLGRIGVAIAF